MKKSIPEGFPLKPVAPPGGEASDGNSFDGTVYEAEIQAYSCILRGDREGTEKEIKALLEKKSTDSRLSVKHENEARYRGVEVISLAARCAAQNGANEDFCLRLADETTAVVDKMADRDEIYAYIPEKCGELATLTAEALSRGDYPCSIKRATEYIAANLHKSLTVTEVAEACGLSPDYLSVRFRQVTGEKMTAYIRKRKLLAARELLKGHGRCSEVAKRLSFCSESYFVKCFREEFGVTPKKFRNSC